ncbi:unnamed protein product [Linum trigynum]|uniref:Uncharacterized protein n=1 Tax=Linum trigynum TaxID=586398 RepID=A0AAV2FE87_9ROSI
MTAVSVTDVSMNGKMLDNKYRCFFPQPKPHAATTSRHRLRRQCLPAGRPLLLPSHIPDTASVHASSFWSKRGLQF